MTNFLHLECCFSFFIFNNLWKNWVTTINITTTDASRFSEDNNISPICSEATMKLPISVFIDVNTVSCNRITERERESVCVCVLLTLGRWVMTRSFFTGGNMLLQWMDTHTHTCTSASCHSHWQHTHFFIHYMKTHTHTHTHTLWKTPCCPTFSLKQSR